MSKMRRRLEWDRNPAPAGTWWLVRDDGTRRLATADEVDAAHVDNGY